MTRLVSYYLLVAEAHTALIRPHFISTTHAHDTCSCTNENHTTCHTCKSHTIILLVGWVRDTNGQTKCHHAHVFNEHWRKRLFHNPTTIHGRHQIQQKDKPATKETPTYNRTRMCTTIHSMNIYRHICISSQGPACIIWAVLALAEKLDNSSLMKQRNSF